MKLTVSMAILVIILLVSALTDAAREEVLTSNKSFFKLDHNGEATGAAAGRQRFKRQATSADLSADEIAAYLDKHNQLRGQTVPPAADMKYMIWDSDLATMAQQWSDMCIWDHGQPTNISPFSSIGQNLYITSGGTPTRRINGTGPVQAWYDEDQYYTYESNSCQTNKVCGHYTQVVWATSYAVGCAQAYCATATGIAWEDTIIVTCNYGPAGNYNRQPYISGTPCTQCDSGIGQCYGNQCRLCSTHNEECVCAQVCENCGTLDNAACSCACPNGFYGSDCGTVCEDTHQYCGANPGWPTSWCDDDHSYVLTNCPALCDLCVSIQDPGYSCDPSTATTAAATDAPTVASTNAPATNAATVALTNAPATNAVTNAATNPRTTAAVGTTACPDVSCSNGGTLDSSTCECMCTSEYQGDTCQHEREQARFGVLVILLADIAFWDYIEPYVVDFVAYILTSFCNDRFQLCCPDSGTKNTTSRLAFVNESHIVTATGYPELYPDISGAFVVMFLVTPPATTELCHQGGTVVPSSRRRREVWTQDDWAWPLRIRKRAVGDGPYLDQDVLLEALEENVDNLTMALSGLNVSVSLVGVEAGQEEPIVTQAPSTSAAPVPRGMPVGVVVAIVVVAMLAVVIVVVVIVICIKSSKLGKVDPNDNEKPDVPGGYENHVMTETAPNA
ncbi:uncharacterized protein LOC110989015 [Acanthaster planci]|uniref:Uncharacterized protein LOC110989015 n=1 Tax=Acanthaster planci TaxID=133434 RepID=A0A8B7ZTL7_ACAPL|nr:uncharacterized protein LOC110989015 [Acanthaster planci]